MKSTLLSTILRAVILPAIALILPGFALAQEYSYTHYDIADGLAGSTLYCITQDKQGFIWVGTEAGISRFDGSHFRNFTTRDGLPDLEVLQMFGDSKGRVWMAPFRTTICYYYQGKIHNAQNDPVLAKIRLHHFIDGFAEDTKGNIAILDRTAIQIVNTDGSVTRFDSLGGEPILGAMVISGSGSGNFQVQVGAKIIEFSATRYIRTITIGSHPDNPCYVMLNRDIAVWEPGAYRFSVLSFPTGRSLNFPLDPAHNNRIGFSILDDSLVYSNETVGSTEYNLHTRKTRKFLPGIRVSKAFRDDFGNLWFATVGKGLYRQNSNEMKTVRLAVGKDEPSSITTIRRMGDQIWAGDDHEYIFRLSLPNLTLQNAVAIPASSYLSDRILYIDSVGRDTIITGSDFGLIEGTHNLQYIRETAGGIKSATRMDGRTLLVGYSWGAGIFDLDKFQVIDTLWHERSTVVFHSGDTIYIGTLNGLYRSINRGPLEFLGEKTPFLRRRIASIAESRDGTLWIASYDDAGIIGYKNGKQTAAITSRQGLTSDFCRTLFLRGDTLWAGTDKGLNRISLDKPGYPIMQFTSRDGLVSDMINALYVDSSIVFVGTPDGMSFFNERDMTTGAHCLLYLTALQNGDRDLIADTSQLVIPYTDTHVRFEFSAISYRSAGDITYRYRLAGLDDKWRETKNNFLEYPDLPAGHYDFQLTALTKFGVPSRLLTIPVEVTAQLWKRPWFIVTAWFASLALVWLLISLRVRRHRRRQQEKERLLREVNQLKNTALKSQMNPHFIFNCLNSIQHSIFAGDTNAANNYISGLARLIRMTLNDSSRSFVTVEDEIDYLNSYLQLEKMRFKEKIEYELVVDPAIDRPAVLIPPMLIQPYVENALHHGLARKNEGKGHITIRFTSNADRLNVVVEDNGIGRAAAENQTQPAAHHSQGMNLTEDRLEILHRLYERPFSITITDLKDNHDHPSGTRIVIDLPLFLETSLYT